MPPLRIRMTCSPRPRAAMTEFHSFSAVWFGMMFMRSSKFEVRILNEEGPEAILNSSFELRTSNLFRYECNRVAWPLPDRDRHHNSLFGDCSRQLAMEPL